MREQFSTDKNISESTTDKSAGEATKHRNQLINECFQAEREHTAMAVEFQYLITTLEQEIEVLSQDLKSRIRDSLEPPINCQDILVGFDNAISRLRQLQIRLACITDGLAKSKARYEFSKLKFLKLAEGFEGSIREFLIQCHQQTDL